ncbi:ABC transporter permease [bacterium]|nr:ABC transporter permease [candidate division CSSED10-310 bacterium]
MRRSITRLRSHLADILKHREILFFLALKDIKIRYRFSSLGFLWAIISPLGQMIILSIVFTFVIRFEIRAYPAFLLIGLLPWSYFNLSLNYTTTSIVDHGGLIKKIYFPREIIPLAQIASNLFDYCVALCILAPFLLFFHVGLSWWILLLPVALLIQVMFTAGISLIFSSLTVYYRDIKYIKELVLMFGFYASPVFYPASFIEKNLGRGAYLVYHLNPMAGIIHLYRRIFYEQAAPSIVLLLYALVVSLIILAFGFVVFERHERSFADLV